MTIQKASIGPSLLQCTMELFDALTAPSRPSLHDEYCKGGFHVPWKQHARHRTRREGESVPVADAGPGLFLSSASETRMAL